MNNWLSPAGSGLVCRMRRVGGCGKERGATGGQRLTGLEFLQRPDTETYFLENVGDSIGILATLEFALSIYEKREFELKG